MNKAEQAACFKVALGASVAASFTTDRIRDEFSCEFSLQLIPGRSITLVEVFLCLPLDRKKEDISSSIVEVGTR